MPESLDEGTNYMAAVVTILTVFAVIGLIVWKVTNNRAKKSQNANSGMKEYFDIS